MRVTQQSLRPSDSRSNRGPKCWVLTGDDETPRESNPGHIGGGRVLSPLCHPCYQIFGTIDMRGFLLSPLKAGFHMIATIAKKKFTDRSDNMETLSAIAAITWKPAFTGSLSAHRGSTFLRSKTTKPLGTR